MKKIVLLITAACLLMSVSVFAGEREKASIGKVKIHFEIGAVKKGCKGIGICGGYGTVEINLRTAIPGYLANENGILTLTVNKQDVPKEFQRHFSSTHFIMEDGFGFNKEILSSIKFKEDYVIQPGKYLIANNSEEYVIIFK